MYELKNKEFIKIYELICSRHNNLEVFSDFVKMCAISIYNTFAKNEMLEKEYLQTINRYSKEEQLLFPKMFGELIMIFEESNEIVDILGNLYMNIKSKDSHLGQIFTPEHVSEFMAEISLGDEQIIKKEIEDNGFITIMDPACGSGRTNSILCKSITKAQYKLSAKSSC